MRFEISGNKMHLYFTHASGRNFVLVEEIVNGDEKLAKAKLTKKMGEMNSGFNPMSVPTEG